MNRILSLLVFLTSSSFMLGQSGPGTSGGPQQVTPPATSTSQLQPGSLIYAELSKSLEAKKAKVGDPVMAKVTQAVLAHGKVIIPKNTKIIGHLTAAQTRSKDQSQSELGIAFDRAELKDRTQVPLTAVSIQALGRPPGFNQPASDIAGPAETSGMPNSAPGGNMGGINSPMGGSRYPSNSGAAGPDMGTGTAGPSTGSASSGSLNAGSHGVVGMPGLRLESQAQGGLVTTGGKNLKLDGGTQIVLRTQ